MSLYLCTDDIILKGRTARRNQTSWKELMFSYNIDLLLLCLIEVLLACFLKPIQHTHTFLGFCTCRPGRGRYFCAAQWHDSWSKLIGVAEPSANQLFDEILFFLFMILFSCPLCPTEESDQCGGTCIPVPGARRGGGRECSARRAGLGAQLRDQAEVWLGCCRCLGGVSLY